MLNMVDKKGTLTSPHKSPQQAGTSLQAFTDLVLRRALVPTAHMADTVGKRSSSKYKEGQEVTGRILEVDSAKKRVSMTLKKLLCSDKLPIITTFQVSFYL